MRMCLLAGAEREALGRCIAGLALRPAPDAAICEPGCHLYTFSKALGSSTSQPASLEDLGFAEGDMVVLSVEGGLPSPNTLHTPPCCAACPLWRHALCRVFGRRVLPNLRLQQQCHEFLQRRSSRGACSRPHPQHCCGCCDRCSGQGASVQPPR